MNAGVLAVAVLSWATACGPLSLELGDDSMPGSGTSGGTGGELAAGGTGGELAAGGTGGELAAGGTGSGATYASQAGSSPAVGTGGSAGAPVVFPDSCPLDVAVAVDCSQYPPEATCKLGDEYYHCEQGLWMNPDWVLVSAPEDLACPLGTADGASCAGYPVEARCCATRDQCYECSAAKLWTRVED